MSHRVDPATAPNFPGGTGVTRLNVYSWDSPDGLCGGSPHLHTASSEGYIVVAGQGRVQTLSAEGYAEHPLVPGTVLWFTPGTVHRLVNDDGALDIVVVMGNAGLPEHGDAVFTFPDEVLADPEKYRAAATLPSGAGSAEMEAAVRARRDLALEGYTGLVDRLNRGDQGALRELHEHAASLVADKTGHWRSLVEAGPLAQANQTLATINQLASGDASPLASATVRGAAPVSTEPLYGMCGRLQTWDLKPATGLRIHG
ncbi:MULTISPECIES: cupin domain-containing protein [unclassified Arthrobacter]|uniref:cupin domain-containing protein n=1 Tax=unclassified Arthrobacter TaxID=235627 RepID=UPI00149180F9|nr:MULTISPECIES: cupin domain-containing protein [unclassified Arthrobacter]MBE0010303.1 cupin domain-containing protein [Arthrobacter sp. AET 35A]NOJ64180.1 cupin domain-containing protein [Arthrobacter sp. 147(2020)]